MLAVGIKTLKNKLSEYVRRASAGEVVLITDRDRVVAELRAPNIGRAERVEDAALADLVAKGILRPPLQRTTTPPRRYEISVPLATLLAEIDRDRGDR